MRLYDNRLVAKKSWQKFAWCCYPCLAAIKNPSWDGNKTMDRTLDCPFNFNCWGYSQLPRNRNLFVCDEWWHRNSQGFMETSPLFTSLIGASHNHFSKSILGSTKTTLTRQLHWLLHPFFSFLFLQQEKRHKHNSSSSEDEGDGSRVPLWHILRRKTVIIQCNDKILLINLRPFPT